MYVVTRGNVSWLVSAESSYLARRAVRCLAEVPIGELKARSATGRDEARFDAEWVEAAARRLRRERIVRGSDTGDLVRDRPR